MSSTVKYNRRKTSRYDLNLHGTLSIHYDDKTLEEPIEINNISYEGMQIVFSSNDFLFEYMNSIEDKHRDVRSKFKYEDKEYEFHHIVNWIRVFNIGERDFYVLTDVSFKYKDEIEEELLDLLLLFLMRNIYVGQPVER